MDVNATTALIRSLRAEALKAAGLPGAWSGAALALVIPALVEYLMDRNMQVRSAAGDPDAMAALPDVGIASVAMGVAGVAVLAASVVAGEYTRDPRNGSSRQVTTTMLVQPRRGAAAAAKLMIVLVAVLVLVTLAAVVSAAVAGQLLGSRTFFSPPSWRRLAGLLMWWEFIAAAAMALTMAARSALLPTTGLILCTTLVSPGNVLLNCTTAVRFLPDIATWRLIASRQSLDAGVLDEILPIPAAVSLWAAWMAVCIALCFRLWIRRDA